MHQMIGNFRTMVLFRGIAAVLFGIITFAWPGITVSVLVLAFGIFAIINGVTVAAAALRNTEERGWALFLIEGVLSILAGLVTLVWPDITALVFLYLLAGWAIITGVMELLAPLSFPMGAGRAASLVLAGIVSVIFGILVASQPASGLLAVTWLISSYAIVFGIMYIVVFFQTRPLAVSVA